MDGENRQGKLPTQNCQTGEGAGTQIALTYVLDETQSASLPEESRVAVFLAAPRAQDSGESQPIDISKEGDRYLRPCWCRGALRPDPEQQ
jgi:hypothetical protein